jgi:hypothetical protein
MDRYELGRWMWNSLSLYSLGELLGWATWLLVLFSFYLFLFRRNNINAWDVGQTPPFFTGRPPIDRTITMGIPFSVKWFRKLSLGFQLVWQGGEDAARAFQGKRT